MTMPEPFERMKDEITEAHRLRMIATTDQGEEITRLYETEWLARARLLAHMMVDSTDALEALEVCLGPISFTP